MVQLLLLGLKQECINQSFNIDLLGIDIKVHLDNHSTNFVQRIIFYWKIGIHFLKYLKGVLEKPLSQDIVKDLATM